jgi:hypothetical protein
MEFDDDMGKGMFCAKTGRSCRSTCYVNISGEPTFLGTMHDLVVMAGIPEEEIGPWINCLWAVIGRIAPYVMQGMGGS